jgi:hypothetical protein
MTDLISPEDTDVLIYSQPRLSVVDTARIPVGEDATRRLTAPPPPPLQALRLGESHPHETGEIPAWPTGAELVVAGRPTAPAAPGARHALTGRVGIYPVVRPSPRPHVVARQRADRRDRRARAASVLVLAVLAATVLVLAVAW